MSKVEIDPVQLQRNHRRARGGIPVEDYYSAFIERALDTECLHEKSRRAGAMHLGGIALECLLKSIIVEYYKIREWKTDYRRPGHGVHNPGHDLIQALRKIPKLMHRVQNNPDIMKMFKKVQHPYGSFIRVRYQGTEPDPESYAEWYTSYKNLVQWLLKQRSQI